MIDVTNLYVKKGGDYEPVETYQPEASFIEGGLDAIYGGACTIGQFIDDKPLVSALLLLLVLYALWIIAGSPPLHFPVPGASKFSDSWGMNAGDDNPTYVNDSWTNVPYKWRA